MVIMKDLVYHILGANGKKYVGSSVNIRERLQTSHEKASEIINSGKYTITFYEVDLGTANTQKEINHILRYHEQKIFDKYRYIPQVDGVLNRNNPAASTKINKYSNEVSQHNAGFTGKKQTLEMH